MHIVYVISPRGGPESFVKTMIPFFEANGDRVSVVYLTNSHTKHPFPSNTQVEFAPCNSLHYYAAKVIGDFRELPRRLRVWEQTKAIQQAIKRIERVSKVDLVEITEEIPIPLLQKYWPVIIRAHGSSWTFRYFCNESSLEQEKRWIQSEAKQLISADAVAAISRHLAEHLEETCNLIKGQIHVIPYPINVELFAPKPPDFSPKSPLLLNTGRIEKRKGVDILVKALPEIWQHSADVRATFLGNEAGFKKKDLLSYIAESNHHLISFPGFVEYQQLPQLYRQATLYIAPTQYETFAYTILEAMACGIPVIASEIGAIPELVENEITGLLVPRNDTKVLAQAILYLLKNEALRLKMGTQARQRAVELYALEKIAQQNLTFYHSVLKAT